MEHRVVLRVAKLRTFGNLSASAQHTWRERLTPHADPSRKIHNVDLRKVAGSEAVLRAVKARIERAGDNHAKDPVLCLEYLVTAHHDAFKENGGTVDADQYLRDSLAWIEAKHGKDNVIAANIQNDERAPHLVAYVVPLVETEGRTRKRSVIVGTNPDGTKKRETRLFQEQGCCKLSAAHFVDGPAKLSHMQTAFAKEVGQKHGLQRGIAGSKAQHTTVRAYYTLVNEAFKPLPKISPPPPRKRWPEPKKPGFFAPQMEKDAYRIDHRAWGDNEREWQAYERQRRLQIIEQNKVALAIARSNEAKAKEAELLRQQLDQVKEANGHYHQKVEKLIGQSAALAEVVSLFTPDEVQKARERQQQALEAKRLAEEQEAKRLEFRQRVEAEKARLLSERAEQQHRQEVRERVQERVQIELDRRVTDLCDRLPEEERTLPDYLFTKIARDALSEAGSEPERVDWKQVEDAFAREAIHFQEVDEDQVLEVLLERSPEQAKRAIVDEMARQEEEEEEEEEEELREIDELEEEDLEDRIKAIAKEEKKDRDENDERVIKDQDKLEHWVAEMAEAAAAGAPIPAKPGMDT